MRRIFGGASLNLQPSQSSDSLSSPAPSVLNGRTDLSSPISPPDDKKGGWFGAAVNGVAGSIRNGTIGGTRPQRSNSTTSSAVSTSQDGGVGVGSTRSVREDQEDALISQPLSNISRYQSPVPVAPVARSTAPRKDRRTSRRSHSGSEQSRYPSAAATGGQLSGRPFLPALEGGAEEVGTLEIGGRTVGEEKDAVMVELLSGQAVVEAREYEIMDWEEMQSTKKEHLVLASRIASLSRSLAFETKLRDSVAKLVRLSTPKDFSGRTSASRPRVTKEQAEAQLVLANEKIAELSTELHKKGWNESELRTRLLQHTAGVLALAIRRKEEEEAGLVPSPLPPSTSFSSSLPSDSVISPQFDLAISSSFAPSPAPRQTDRFEGHHFFAGNKDAIIPLPRSPSLNSPQLVASSSNIVPSIDATIVRQLEAQVAELRSSLANASPPLPRLDTGKLEQLRAELSAAANAEETARKEAASSRREVGELQAETEELMKDVEVSREDLRGAEDTTAALRREMGVLRSKLEDAQSGSAAIGAKELTETKEEVAELRRNVEMGEQELQEVRRRAESAERGVVELEEEIEEVKAGYEREAAQVQATLRELEASATAKNERDVEDQGRLRSEQQKVVQAIGDILRRHRTRPTLGLAIRDLPSFDDTADHADLPSYLASTLDAHFESLTIHVSSLSDEFASTLEEQSQAQAELRTELKQAVDHRERWRSEAEAHRRDKEKLELAQADLESQLDAHEARLAAQPALEQNLDLAAAEAARLRQELDAVQTRATFVDAQFTDAMAQQSKTLKTLQDLWRTFPPLEVRATSSHSDDLSVPKAAFEAPRRPLGNFVWDAAASKFTVEGLAERIRVLLIDDTKLVQKLAAFEAAQDAHKGNAERAQRMLAEREVGIQGHQQQVHDLEERMRISADQEVSYLERLNDLTESLEQTRGEKRKLEAVISSAQSQARALEEEKTRLSQSLTAAQLDVTRLNARPDDSAKTEKLESDLQDAKDQLADAEEELEDAKKREQKQRSQLLDELSQVQQEVSSLKTQLRQEQRKRAK